MKLKRNITGENSYDVSEILKEAKRPKGRAVLLFFFFLCFLCYGFYFFGYMLFLSVLIFVFLLGYLFFYKDKYGHILDFWDKSWWWKSVISDFLDHWFVEYVVDGNVKVWYYANPRHQEVEYYHSSDIKEENDFKNMAHTGVSRLYYENGQLKRQIGFKRGLAEGQCTEFYETGELLTKEFYKEAKLEGISYLYHKNGQIECERHYEKGVLIGECKTYYSDGQLKSVTNYVNGVPQGISRTYYPNGMPEMEKNYEKGKIVSKHRFYRHKYKFIENNIEGNVGEEK